MRRHLAGILLPVCLLASCGGGSSAAPTVVTTPPPAPAPAPTPPRATISLESWGYVSCVALAAFNCKVTLTVRNQGPDCASDVRATLHVTASDGTAVRDVQFDLLASLTLRPNETHQQTTASFFEFRTTTDTRGRLEAFTTPVKCS